MFIPSSAQCLCSLKYPSTACFTYLYVPRHHRSSGQTLLQAPRNSSLDDATPRNQERDSFGSSNAPATGFLETTFKNNWSGWWFQIFCMFNPFWGRFPFWRIVFQMGWNHQPVVFFFQVCITFCWYLSREIPESLLNRRFFFSRVHCDTASDTKKVTPFRRCHDELAVVKMGSPHFFTSVFGWPTPIQMEPPKLVDWKNGWKMWGFFSLHWKKSTKDDERVMCEKSGLCFSAWQSVTH